MDLLYLLHSLLRKKWIIIFCTLIGGVAGFVFNLFREKEYTSLSQYSTGFTMEKKIKIQEGENADFFQIDTRFNNINVAFSSDKVTGMLTYKLMLHDLEDRTPFRTLKPEQLKEKNITPADLEFAKKILRQKISDLELLSSYEPNEKKVLELIKLYKYDPMSLGKKVTMDRLERTDFINIFAHSENPHLSAFMANTAGDQLIRFFNDIYGVRLKSSSEKLDSITKIKKFIVDSLSARLQDFKARTGPTTSGDKATAAMGVVTELYGKYQEETRELNRLKAEKEAIETQLANLGDNTVATTNATAGNNKVILQLKQRNEDLQKELLGKTDEQKKKIQDEIDNNITKMLQLSATKSPSNTAEKEKKNTRRDELLNRKIELESQIIATEHNVEQFKREKDKYEALINVGGGDDVMVQQMERDLQLATKEYEVMRQSLQGALDNDVNPENNFKQTNIGMPAEKPSPGRTVIIAGLSGGLMFFFSTFLFLIMAFLDTSYKTADRFKFQTGLPLLGTVKKADESGEKVWSQFQEKEAATPKDAILIEGLRKLRFEIENSGKKSILFTSARAGEGKSFIIESLAASISITKKKILIIDANFSNNTLTREFEAKPVLDKISIAPNDALTEKLSGVTSMTPFAGTTIIGCASGTNTPAEVLPKNHIFKQLSKLGELYDFILIEAASLNHYPDSKELSEYVDGIVLVVDARSSAEPSDKDSYEFVNASGDKFIGSVLNAVQKHDMKY